MLLQSTESQSLTVWYTPGLYRILVMSARVSTCFQSMCHIKSNPIHTTHICYCSFWVQMMQGGGLMGFNGRGNSGNGIGPNYSNGLLQTLGLPQYGNGGTQHTNLYDNLGGWCT